LPKDNGQIMEIVKELNSFDGKNIIETVEQQVTTLKEAILPFLSEQLIEQHQVGFKGKERE